MLHRSIAEGSRWKTVAILHSFAVTRPRSSLQVLG